MLQCYRLLDQAKVLAVTLGAKMRIGRCNLFYFCMHGRCSLVSTDIYGLVKDVYGNFVQADQLH
jgi:hypothetical protein